MATPSSSATLPPIAAATTPSPVPAVSSTAAAAASSGAPIRESQIASAVSFLSNPRVSSSSPHRRFAFLESKGLTPQEIYEAVRRVTPHAQSELEAISAAISAGKSVTDSTKHLDYQTSTSQYQTGMPSFAPFASVAPPPAPTPRTDWTKWLLGLIAVGGATSTAVLLTHSSLPRLKLEYPDDSSNVAQPGVQPALTTSSSSAIPTVAITSPPSPPDSPSSSPALSRLSLSALADDSSSREAALLKCLSELRDEMGAMHETVKQSSMDSRRLLMAMQQGINNIHHSANSSNSNGERPNGTMNGVSDSQPFSLTSSSSPSPPPVTTSLVTVESESASVTAAIDADGATSLTGAPLEARLSTLRDRAAFLTANNSVESLTPCLKTLQMYVTNLVSNIDSTNNRYSRIPIANAQYRQRVAAVQGAQDFLVAAGFVAKSNNLEYKNASDKQEDVRLLTEAKELLIAAQNELAERKADNASGTTANQSSPLASSNDS